MGDKAVAKNTHDAVPTDKKLDDLYDLMDGIEIAMLTTRRAVSGFATVTTDRELVQELYKPDWNAWLGNAGGNRDGSANRAAERDRPA